MEEKKEVKYLDLCANTQLDLKEILERLMNPAQRTAKEDKENDDNG